MTRLIRRLICVTALLAAMPGAVARAQTQGDPEEFTAFAVNMGVADRHRRDRTADHQHQPLELGGRAR